MSDICYFITCRGNPYHFHISARDVLYAHYPRQEARTIAFGILTSNTGWEGGPHSRNESTEVVQSCHELTRFSPPPYSMFIDSEISMFV